MTATRWHGQTEPEFLDDGPCWLGEWWDACPACRSTLVRQPPMQHRRTLRGRPVCGECQDDMMDAQQRAEDEEMSA